MNGFNGLILLFVYFAVMMAATLLFARKGNGADDFYVGNRKMGAVASAMSIAATWIWAPAQNTEVQGTAPADDPERAETGRFVICPKCGERIWL